MSGKPFSHNAKPRHQIIRLLGAFFLTLLACLVLGSCGGGGGEAPASSAKDITTFNFAKSNNTGLGTDMAGTVAGDTILVTSPFGVDRSALVASFTALGVSVKVGAVLQTSGASSLNFSKPVSYEVKAADGSLKYYTVTVVNAPVTAKDITRFAFTPAANSRLASSIEGAISGETIGVVLPQGVSRSALAATFSSTGASVAVGGAVQASGVSVLDFTNPVVYTATAADGSRKNYTVTVGNAATSAAQITSFSVLGINANITGTSIALTLPFGVSRSALVATFSSTGASVKVAGKAQISGATGNNFEAPLVYLVTADDGSTSSYTVSVNNLLNNANDLSAFSVAGINGNIVGTAISVTLPYSMARTALVATFTSTGDTVKVGAQLQTSGLTSNSFAAPLIYTVTAQDGSTKDYTVTVGNAANAAKDITAFSVLGVNGSIVGSAITVTLPYGTDRSALVATFATTSAAVNVGGASQASGLTPNNFRNPVQYTVTAEDGSTKVFTVDISNALVANAGTAQNVATNSLVTLDGSASADPNGAVLIYSWIFISKPVGSSAVLSSTTIVKPTFTADIEGTYTVNLVVSDGKTNSNASTISIIAVPTLFTSNASFYSLDGNSGTWDAVNGKLSVLKTGPEWGVTLAYQPVNLVAGRTYSLSFTCSSPYSSSYVIRVLPSDGKVGTYGYQSMRCDGQTKNINFVSPASDSAAKISLNFGTTPGEYVLGKSITVTQGVQSAAPVVPGGAIWWQQAIEHDIAPPNYSAVLIWAQAATLSPTQSTSDTAKVEINYWKVIENLPNGTKRMVLEDGYDIDNTNFTSGALYIRTPSWFADNSNAPAFNMKTEAGLLVIDASQTPNNIVHLWTNRLPLTSGATYSAEIQFKVTGKTAIQFGSDWWRYLIAPYINWQWDCTKINNCEAWLSDWYGDTGGKFITVIVPNR